MKRYIFLVTLEDGSQFLTRSILPLHWFDKSFLLVGTRHGS